MNLDKVLSILVDAFLKEEIKAFELNKDLGQIILTIAKCNSSGIDSIPSIKKRLSDEGFVWRDADNREDGSAEWHLFTRSD